MTDLSNSGVSGQELKTLQRGFKRSQIHRNTLSRQLAVLGLDRKQFATRTSGEARRAA